MFCMYNFGKKIGIILLWKLFCKIVKDENVNYIWDILKIYVLVVYYFNIGVFVWE